MRPAPFLRSFFVPFAVLGVASCGSTPLDVVKLTRQPTDAGWPDASDAPSVPDAPVVDRMLPPRPSGLVAHWSFDEGAGIIARDDSGNGYHAHLVGGTWVPGRFKGGLAIARGEYVAVNGFQDATPAWTVSAWVRLTSTQVHGVWGAIVSTEVPEQGGWMVYLEGEAPFELPRLNFDFARPGSTRLASVGCCSLLDADVWYHVTAVADAFAGTVTLYDGTQAEGTISIASTLTPGDPTLFMGTWRGLDVDPTLGGWLSGTIDDVSIFSRALDASEIAALDLAPP
jgi:hypothetical protein